MGAEHFQILEFAPISQTKKAVILECSFLQTKKCFMDCLMTLCLMIN